MNKFCISFLTTTLFCGPATAQKTAFHDDSLHQNAITRIDSLTKSKYASSLHTFDSLRKFASLSRLKDSLTVITWADSMRLKVNARFTNDSDRLSRKIDSLEHLKLPATRYRQKADSLIGKKDALLTEINSKQKDLDRIVTDRYTTWEKSVRSKLKLDSLGISTNVNVPGMEGLGIKAGQMPGLPGGVNNAGLPKLPVFNSKDFADLGLSKDLSSIGGKTSVPGIGELQHWQQNFSGLTDPVKDVKGKMNEAGALAKDPSKAAEGAVGQVKEVKALNQKVSGAEKLMKDNEALQVADKMKDPKAMQAEVKEKGIEQAVNHFAGQEEILKKSMGDISKYKAKYKSLGSLSEVKKKWQPVNSLKGTSFRERFHPGINFGLQNKKDTISLDFYPNAAYQISGRFELGAGAMYRLTILEKTREVDQHNPVWGLNSFTTIRLFKATRLRAELDGVSNPLRPKDADSYIARAWQWKFVAGIQNNFKIGKSISANVQLLYNFEKKLKDAFPEKLSVRIGIQYNLPKKKVP